MGNVDQRHRSGLRLHLADVGHHADDRQPRCRVGGIVLIAAQVKSDATAERRCDRRSVSPTNRWLTMAVCFPGRPSSGENARPAVIATPTVAK